MYMELNKHHYLFIGKSFSDLRTNNKEFYDWLLTTYVSMNNYAFQMFDIAFNAMSMTQKTSVYNILYQAWKTKANMPASNRINRVIFNDPATIVFWGDGSKTVVKAENEPFDPEKGLAMAIAKHSFGNEGNYYNEFRKWLPEKKTDISQNTKTEAKVIYEPNQKLKNGDILENTFDEISDKISKAVNKALEEERKKDFEVYKALFEKSGEEKNDQLSV